MFHLPGLWTPSRLRDAALSRLRQEVGKPALLGGPESEGQELNIPPEAGLPVWAPSPLALPSLALLPHGLLLLSNSPGDENQKHKRMNINVNV